MPSPKGLIKTEKMRTVTVPQCPPTLCWARAQILQSKYCQSHFTDEGTEVWEDLIAHPMPQVGSGRVNF